MKLLYTISFLFIAFFTGFSSVYAQAPSIQWSKSFGGSTYENALSVTQTFDGGSIAAGISTSTDGDVTGNRGFGDVWIVKLDNAGALEWQKTYGSSGDDGAFAIVQTIDSGYAIAATSNAANGDVTVNHGLVDCWILKIDKLGVLQWQKSFGGSSIDIAYDIKQTTDLGFIVAGYTQSTDGDITSLHGFEDYWIIKLDNSGNLQWQKTFGGTEDERAWSVQQTADGGYIAGGYTRSNDGDVTGNHGDYDFWVVKLDGSGTLQWQKALGGSLLDKNRTVIQTADGGYITAGYTASTDGDVTGTQVPFSEDLWIAKLDGSGVLQWQKSYGGTGVEQAYQVKQLTDGSYLFAGSSYSTDGDVTGNHGGTDSWCLQTDNNGALLWEKSFGGSDYDETYAVAIANDGGFLVAGLSLSADGDLTQNQGDFDYWIFKLGGAVTTAGYTFNNVAPATAGCGDQSSAITLASTATGGFATAINLAATGNPAGTTVNFSVNPLAPGSSTVVTLANINTLTPGTYPITITGTAGTITQTTILSYTILPGTAPAVTTQPLPVSVCAGNDAAFSITVPGTGISYQWQVSQTGCAGSFTDIAGANSSGYTLTATSSSQEGYAYQVIVSSGCSATTTTSSCALLTVNNLPAISANADATQVCSGNPVVLTASGAGSSGSYTWAPNGLTGTTITVNPQVNPATPAIANPVNYTVTGIDGNGCQGNTTVTVTANPLPIVTLSSSPLLTALLPGQTALLTASVNPPGNYGFAWQKDGIDIQNTSPTLTVGYNDIGVYSVTASSVSNCSGTSNTVKVSDSTITHLYIYPNPNDGQFNISYYDPTGSLSGTAVVFDSKGARVLAKAFVVIQQGQVISVDLRSMASGVYVLVLYNSSGKSIWVERIVVKHQ